jgi:hypothetical protein
VPCRSRLWVWTGRATFGVIVVGLVVYLVVAGLDKADKLASSISVVVALAALGAPYLSACFLVRGCLDGGDGPGSEHGCGPRRGRGAG